MPVSSLTSQPKKLPSLLAIILIIAGFAAGIWLVNKTNFLGLRASSEIAPKQIKITNIGSSSFVVSWLTDEQAKGVVTYGTNQSLEETKNDIRDKLTPLLYLTHYVVVDNLKPETKYYFKIFSNGKPFNQLFEISTGPMKVPADNDIAQGKILKNDGGPAEGAIVYLSLANTITQSALTDKDGSWMIPLSVARTLDLSNFSSFDRMAQIEEILVQMEGQSATATLSTAADNPTPDIVLGQTYDFLNQLPNISPTPPINQSINPNLGSQSGFQNLSSDQELTIDFPSENEKINSQLPEFFGTAPKNQPLKVIVESEEKIDSKTTTTQNGSWKWAPPKPLSPGEHTITVYYTNKQGFLEKVSRTFTVLAVGESDLPSFTASPSGQKTTPTLVPTITPTPTVTSTPKLSPTITPTLGPTVLPTVITPTPTVILNTSTPIPTKPVSGVDTPTKFFVGAGVMTLLIGAVLLLF